MVQVARIAGQLLQDNLQRELADLAFDTDLLVVKRDNTLGINTTTTPRNLTINGTLRTSSGSSDPDIIFSNSISVGNLTLASSGKCERLLYAAAIETASPPLECPINRTLFKSAF